MYRAVKRASRATVGRLSLALALTLGCGEEPQDQPNLDCEWTEPTKGSVTGALEIGTGGPNDFQAYADGQTEQLVRGTQGGYMILPELRADASALATDGRCVRVVMNALIEPLAGETVGVSAPTISLTLPPLARKGGAFYVDPIPLFLSLDVNSLVGRHTQISAEFMDAQHYATAEARVLLASPP